MPQEHRAVEIRPITDDELPAWLTLKDRALARGRRVDEESVAQRRRAFAGQRVHAALDGAQIVGTFRSWDVDLPVPGGATAKVEAISSVAVAATHRRRGVLSAMMTADLTATRERGVAMAVLIAAEAPIYGRFGFGAAVEHCTQVVHCQQATAVARGLDEAAGDSVSLELVEDADLRAVAPAVYAGAAVGMPGAMPRVALGWDVELGIEASGGDDASVARPAVLAYDVTGEVVGYARYRLRGAWADGHSDTTLDLLDLAATTPTAHAALWRHLVDTDLVTTIRAEHRPVHDPLPWLLADRRAARQVDRDDFVWVRVLDPVAALVERRAGAVGAGVLEVVDDSGLAAGRVRWEAGADGVLHAEETLAEPDVVIAVDALGSVVLGQIPVSVLHAAGRVVDRTSGAVRRLGAVLASAPTTWPTLTSF